jgi:hypothetical protein
MSVRGCILDLLPGEMHRQPGRGPSDLLDPSRRNEHVIAEPPVAGVDAKLLHRPTEVINEKALHVAEH